jgi:hypothetical protein
MCKMKINSVVSKPIFAALILAMLAVSGFGQRISVESATLKANGEPIFINGANTPWDNWSDFGGNYNSAWWNAEFARIKAAGGNATRIWMTCSGETAINIDATGYVSGATQAHWDNLADLFSLAQANKIYVLVTLISFDHTKNTYTTYQKWRNMYTSQANVGSFVDNYVVPFVTKFGSNPYLFAIEPCNEIEWVNQDTTNAQLPWETLQYFVARVVSAVHKNSSVLTTVGNNVKWQTDLWSGGALEAFSDARLKAQYNDASVYLDVYSPHFYDWVVQWYGSPFLTNTPADYGLADKPMIIGEVPANGVGGLPIVDCFMNAYANGVQGVMPWTSNGVDSCGSLDTGLGTALTKFASSFPEMVNPQSGVTPGPKPSPFPGYDCSAGVFWDATTVYDQPGTLVIYNNHLYKNNWYSMGDNPQANSGSYMVWTDLGPCDGATTPEPNTTPAPTGVPTSVPTTGPTAVPTIAPTPAPTAASNIGDVNSSGTIDIVDALLVAQYYVGLNPAGFVLANGDTNCSGTVDVVDALRIAQYYVGLLTSLAC